LSQHERGLTGFSAAQIFWLSHILDVPASYFYTGLQPMTLTKVTLRTELEKV